MQRWYASDWRCLRWWWWPRRWLEEWNQLTPLPPLFKRWHQRVLVAGATGATGLSFSSTTSSSSSCHHWFWCWLGRPNKLTHNKTSSYQPHILKGNPRDKWGSIVELCESGIKCKVCHKSSTWHFVKPTWVANVETFYVYIRKCLLILSETILYRARCNFLQWISNRFMGLGSSSIHALWIFMECYHYCSHHSPVWRLSGHS